MYKSSWVKFSWDTCPRKLVPNENFYVHGIFYYRYGLFLDYLQIRVKTDTENIDRKKVETNTLTTESSTWAMAEQEYLHTGKLPYFPTDTKRVVFLIR